MTREEEIIEAGVEYTMKNRPNVLAGGKFSEEMKRFNRNKAFEEGAKWAEKLLKEKLNEFLENTDFEMQYFDSEGLFDKGLFIKDINSILNE